MRIEASDITILVPTYNRILFLTILIGSIAAQTKKGFSVIISDNCSSDGTVDVLKSLAIEGVNLTTVIQEFNIGAARNHGDLLTRAKTKWCCFASDDDILEKTFIHTVCSYAYEQKFSIIIPRHESIDCEGSRLQSRIHHKIEMAGGVYGASDIFRPYMKPKMITAGVGGFLFRKEMVDNRLIKAMSGYPGGFFGDTLLVLSLVLRMPAYIIDAPVQYRRRIWTGQETNSQSLAKYLQALLKFYLHAQITYAMIPSNSHERKTVSGYITYLKMTSEWFVLQILAKVYTVGIRQSLPLRDISRFNSV